MVVLEVGVGGEVVNRGFAGQASCLRELQIEK